MKESTRQIRRMRQWSHQLNELLDTIEERDSKDQGARIQLEAASYTVRDIDGAIAAILGQPVAPAKTIL